MSRKRNIKPPAFTPFWNTKSKSWYICNASGTSIASFKPLSDDLLDILHAYLLATKAANKLANKYFKNM